MWSFRLFFWGGWGGGVQLCRDTFGPRLVGSRGRFRVYVLGFSGLGFRGLGVIKV